MCHAKSIFKIGNRIKQRVNHQITINCHAQNYSQGILPRSAKVNSSHYSSKQWKILCILASRPTSHTYTIVASPFIYHTRTTEYRGLDVYIYMVSDQPHTLLRKGRGGWGAGGCKSLSHGLPRDDAKKQRSHGGNGKKLQSRRAKTPLLSLSLVALAN